jgi:hypothetical protein
VTQHHQADDLPIEGRLIAVSKLASVPTASEFVSADTQSGAHAFIEEPIRPLGAEKAVLVLLRILVRTSDVVGLSKSVDTSPSADLLAPVTMFILVDSLLRQRADIEGWHRTCARGTREWAARNAYT